MKKIYLFFAFLISLNLTISGQNNILVIDYNDGFTSDQRSNKSLIYTRLLITQASVVRISNMPVGIDPAVYNQVWIFGDMGNPVAANLNPVINYMNAGGAVYVQSEVACCNNQAAYLDSLINLTVIAGGSITHNAIKTSSPYQFQADPAVICTPLPFIHYGNAARPFPGTPASNVLFRGTNFCGTDTDSTDIIGVQFRNTDMIFGNGALIGIGDLNLFPLASSCGPTSLPGVANNNDIVDLIANLLSNLVYGSTVPTVIQPSNITVCHGDNVPTSNFIAPSGATFAWTNSNTAIGLGAAGSGNIAEFTATNSTTNPITATISVTAIANGCPGPSSNYTITVNPIPSSAFTLFPSTVCAGENTTITYTGSAPADATYKWSFDGGNVVSGSGQGPYAVNWASSGAKNVTLTVAERECASSLTTQTVMVNLDNASFSYSKSTFCQTDADPSPTVTGLAGGVFFSTAGLSIDAATGVINLAASTLGNYIVTYATNGTCPSSSNFAVTITLSPDASFYYDGAYCQNASADPFPTFPPGASAGTFGATPAGLAFINIITGQIDLIASAPGTYTVTNSIPASGSCPAASFDTTVTIHITPVLSITDPDTTCSATLDLTAPEVTTGSTGGGTFSYWTDAMATNTLASPDAVAVSGTYYIKVATSENCSDIESVIVTINPTPAPTFNFTSPVCVGNNSSLTYSGNAAAGASFSWDFDGGTEAGSGSGPYTVKWNSPGQKNVSLSVTETGCTSDLTMHTVTVNQDDASFSYSPKIFCPSDPNPSPTITGLAGGTFNSTAGLSINDSTGEINLATSIPGPYTISYTTNGSCSNTSSFDIIITEAISLSVSPNITICERESTVLNVTATGGTGSYTYNWSAAGENKTSVTVSPSATASYTIEVTDTNNCTALDTITVTVHALPIVSFIADTDSGCAPLCVLFSNKTPKAASTSWSFGDGHFSTKSRISHCYRQSGYYSIALAVTDSNGCSNSLYTPDLIKVFPKPIAAFTMAPPNTAQVHTSVLFNDHSSGAYHCNWNFGDALLTSSQLKNPTFTYTKAGSYKVNLLVSNEEGCTDSISHIMIIESDFTIYIPNAFSPDEDGLNDFFAPKGINFEAFEMEIYNRWGERIYHTTEIDKPWDGRAKGVAEISKQDVYVYKIWVKDFKGEIHYYVGNVTLIK